VDEQEDGSVNETGPAAATLTSIIGDALQAGSHVLAQGRIPMATNLVSLVMQFLTPEMVGRIASALGLDRGSTQSAIAAAVPALLAGLSNVASQPEGAQKLADAVRQQSTALGGFIDKLGPGNQASLIDKGTQILSSLIGGRDQTALAGAVGSFAGVGRGAGTSLLGILAPAVMGTIAQQSGRGIDGAGIANLLAGQKDNIAKALPAGFGDMLADTDLLGSLGGAARAASAAATGTARAASAAASSAAYGIGDARRRAADAAGTSALRWTYWAIPLLAIAAVAIYLFSRSADDMIVGGLGTAQNLTVKGVDLGGQIADNVSSLRTTLAGITDAASAENALPKLKEITAQLDNVAGLKGQLTATQRTTLSGLVNPAMPPINELVQKVLAIPGVAEVLKPTLDTLTTKLSTLAA
jgi:hypothetical protein